MTEDYELVEDIGFYSVEPLRQRVANGDCIGVVNIDIDYGHDTGDGVLRSIASRMGNHLKEKDLETLISKADMAMYEEKRRE